MKKALHNFDRNDLYSYCKNNCMKCELRCVCSICDKPLRMILAYKRARDTDFTGSMEKMLYLGKGEIK